LLDDDGLMALLYVGKLGFYTLPGGGVEPGETLTETLRREMLEETGCACQIVSELGRIEESRVLHDFTQESFYYLARVQGPKGPLSLTREEMDEDTQVHWYAIEEAFDLVSKARPENYQRTYVQRRDMAVLREAMLKLNA
jgi:8-oxo-dGTP pyrophosphatase MutT (NUDIX family)